MPMKTILAPIDFSPVSRRVIDEAVILARAYAARVVVLHVVPPPPIVGEIALVSDEVMHFTEAWMKGARDRLNEVQRRLKGDRIAVETRCVAGRPAEQILAQAEEVGAHYVVVGSHGYTALRELVVGGTTMVVLRRATGRVVVVPHLAADSAWGARKQA